MLNVISEADRARRDMQKRIKDRYAQSGRLIPDMIASIRRRESSMERLELPLETVWFGQLSVAYKSMTDRRPFVEAVCALGHWPTRLGYAHSWASFIYAAYETAQANHLTEFLPKTTLLMADRAYDSHDFDGAFTFAEQAIRLAEQYGDFATLGVAINYGVALYAARDLAREALALVKSIEERGVIGPESEPSVRFFLNYAYLRAYRNLAEFEQARHYANKLLQIEAECTDRYWRVILHHEVGLLEWRVGNFDAAERQFLTYYERLSQIDQANQVGALAELGNLALSRGRLSNSEDFFQKAYRFAAERTNQVSIFKAKNYIARLRWAQGRLEEAMAENNQALEMAQNLKHGDVTRIIGNRGSYRFDLGDVAGAEQDLMHEYHHQNPNTNWRVWTAAMLSRVCRVTGRPSEARAYADEALRTACAKKAQAHIALAHYAVAECANSPMEAWAHYEQALEIVKGRQWMAEALCYFGFTRLDPDPEQRAAWWAKGVQILKEIGAERWLEGRTPDNPPLLPMID
jgi:tetratricopeptide (TPR) repeat protein